MLKPVRAVWVERQRWFGLLAAVVVSVAFVTATLALGGLTRSTLDGALDGRFGGVDVVLRAGGGQEIGGAALRAAVPGDVASAMAASGDLVAVAGVRITLFVPSVLFSYAVTVLWLVTVTNAFNFMDNMNGLSAGVGAIAAGWFAVAAASHGQYLVALLALLVCGALVGYLPFNFPRATVFASAGDAAHWLSPEVASRAPEGAQRFFQMARDGVAPYVQADRFKTFTGDAEILPGIAPVLSHGHTPGHTSYLLRSRGQQLLVWGDIVHNAAVQFPRPAVTIEFDSDSRQALATRLKLLGWTARDALMVAGAHLPFPGLGQVRAEGKGRFAWVPLDYAPVAP